ncbi:MAG: hypothetical protein ACM31O_03655 [Bacteroidota bacterium]
MSHRALEIAHTYHVRFCWYMPVSATYTVEVKPGTRAEEIVEQALAEAEADCWDQQVDDYESPGPTFVDAIDAESDEPPVAIPQKWVEDIVLGIDPLKDLARTVAGIDDRWLDAADDSALRATLRELIDTARTAKDAAGL